MSGDKFGILDLSTYFSVRFNVSVIHRVMIDDVWLTAWYFYILSSVNVETNCGSAIVERMYLFEMGVHGGEGKMSDGASWWFS